MKRSTLVIATLLLGFSFVLVVVLRLTIPTASTVVQQDSQQVVVRLSSTGNTSRYMPLGMPIAGEKVSQSQAAERIPYHFPEFAYLPATMSVSEVWVSGAATPKSDRSLAMVFSADGVPIDWSADATPIGQSILLIVHQENGRTNWDSLVEPPFQLVEVNSQQGIGTDPGTQTLADGSEWHYPGSVEWKQGNLDITIYGNYSLAELLKVAESLRF